MNFFLKLHNSALACGGEGVMVNLNKQVTDNDSFLSFDWSNTFLNCLIFLIYYYDDDHHHHYHYCCFNITKM